MENKQSFEYALEKIEKDIAGTSLMKELQQAKNYSDILRALLNGAFAVDFVVEEMSKDATIVGMFSVAFKHGSVSPKINYDRYEFLGDALIGLFICEYLMDNYPTWSQHQLTLVKHQMVSSRYLGDYFIKPSGLLNFLVPKYSALKNERVFQGEKGSEKYDKIPGDLLESIVGGLYVVSKLKYGDTVATALVRNLVMSFLVFAPRVEPVTDSKTQYKELLDKNGRLGRLSDLTQKTITEDGGVKVYTIKVFAINPKNGKKELMGSFSGKNERAASTGAFGMALKKLNELKQSWGLK